VKQWWEDNKYTKALDFYSDEKENRCHSAKGSLFKFDCQKKNRDVCTL